MPKNNLKNIPTILLILDGWGIYKAKTDSSAITPASAPNYYEWIKKYPHTALKASGKDVGLFKNQEGNSEAGHLNIGAGRVVKQDALYISDAIADGTFFKNPAFEQALHHVTKYKTNVHVFGLLSNHNSAHSCPEHLYALLDLLHEKKMNRVFLHLFTDGRDSGQHDAPTHLRKLLAHFHGAEKIATVMGRLYGMDRNKIWDRTKLAYEAMVMGHGKRTAPSAEEAITEAYDSKESDEFISPTIITENGAPTATIKDNDAVIFFNLRSDRARQLTKVFVQKNFENLNPDSFKRTHLPKNIRFVAMTDFGPDLPGVLTAFPSRDVPDSLVVTLCPRRQLYVAESEKFAHVTYFLNGGYAQHFCDERWVKIASDRVKDFETDPTMKADQIGEYLVKAIKGGEYEFIAANFANADMLGHTGNIKAAKIGVATVDKALQKVVAAALEVGGQIIITADHGNAEVMINPETKAPDSEHSANPVPFIFIAPPATLKKFGMEKKLSLKPGRLADVAPTILKIMGIKKPSAMTGRALF